MAKKRPSTAEIKQGLQAIFVLPFDLAPPLEPLKQAIRTHEDRFFDLNRQQLDRGLDSNGKSLGRYKNFKYKGRWAPVDLLKEGDFRKEFTLEVTDKYSEIFSQDWKDDILTKRYGSAIYGVPSQLLPNVISALEPDFLNNYEKRLLNGIR